MTNGAKLFVSALKWSKRSGCGLLKTGAELESKCNNLYYPQFGS